MYHSLYVTHTTAGSTHRSPNSLTSGPNYIRFINFFIMTLPNFKRDINQQYFQIVDLHFVKSESFSLTRSCESRQRDTTSSVWKLFRFYKMEAKESNRTHSRFQCSFNIETYSLSLCIGCMVKYMWAYSPTFANFPKMFKIFITLVAI